MSPDRSRLVDFQRRTYRNEFRSTLNPSWIKWANDKADWFDPITKRKDELLNDNDINDILNPKQTNYYR